MVLIGNHATSFVNAYTQGLLCLHPTDTLVGLTSNDYAALTAYKQRPPQHGYVHLAAGFEHACRAWQPLPASWDKLLQTIWPAPLTVVWQAASPTQPGTQDGWLAIRVPRLFPPHKKWFATCLHTLQLIPSTSVNTHRHTPLTPAVASRQLQDDARIHVPVPLQLTTNNTLATPSTLIKLQHDGSWQLLRRGAYATTHLPDCCNNL